MTVKEATKLCFVVQKSYPKYFEKYNKDDTQVMIDMWAKVSEGYSYEQMNAGLIQFMRSDDKGFPPTIGQVINQVERLRPQDATAMTEAEAWSIIHAAICDSTYHAQERFDALPPVLQRAVGSPQNLKEWAMMEDGELKLPVIESNVMRSFKAAAKMEREERLIPESIKGLIGQMFETKAIETKEATNYDDTV